MKNLKGGYAIQGPHPWGLTRFRGAKPQTVWYTKTCEWSGYFPRKFFETREEALEAIGRAKKRMVKQEASVLNPQYPPIMKRKWSDFTLMYRGKRRWHFAVALEKLKVVKVTVSKA